MVAKLASWACSVINETVCSIEGIWRGQYFDMKSRPGRLPDLLQSNNWREWNMKKWKMKGKSLNLSSTKRIFRSSSSSNKIWIILTPTELYFFSMLTSLVLLVFQTYFPHYALCTAKSLIQSSGKGLIIILAILFSYERNTRVYHYISNHLFKMFGLKWFPKVTSRPVDYRKEKMAKSSSKITDLWAEPVPVCFTVCKWICTVLLFSRLVTKRIKYFVTLIAKNLEQSLDQFEHYSCVRLFRNKSFCIF